jgi:hypothetical protein
MWTVVHMPKAAVNKNDLPAGDEYEIGLSRQSLAMERVTIPHGMSQTSDDHLRGRVLPADRAHTFAALFRSK